MKTSGKERSCENEKEEAKPSEKTENIIAITVFVLLIVVSIGFFTKGFGLFDKAGGVDDNSRIHVPLGNDPFKGNFNASVLIVAFSDYDCPFCRKAENTMNNIFEKYSEDVVYLFKDMPLTSIHPDAYNAALAAECAKEQDKYWEYHDYLYEHNDQLDPQYLKEYANLLGLDTEQFNDCFATQKYKGEVDKDIQTARMVGVTGTPTFFINGIKIVGAQAEEEFIKVINSELKK